MELVFGWLKLMVLVDWRNKTNRLDGCGEVSTYMSRFVGWVISLFHCQPCVMDLFSAHDD